MDTVPAQIVFALPSLMAGFVTFRTKRTDDKIDRFIAALTEEERVLVNSTNAGAEFGSPLFLRQTSERTWKQIGERPDSEPLMALFVVFGLQVALSVWLILIDPTNWAIVTVAGSAHCNPGVVDGRSRPESAATVSCETRQLDSHGTRRCSERDATEGPRCGRGRLVSVDRSRRHVGASNRESRNCS